MPHHNMFQPSEVVVVSLSIIFLVFVVHSNAAQTDIGSISDISAQSPSSLTNADQLQDGVPAFLRTSRQGTPGFVRIGRHGNFVRIGRQSSFVRIGRGDNGNEILGLDGRDEDDKESEMNPLPNTFYDQPWYRHLHRFVRIGRHGNKMQISRRGKLNFVRIGRTGHSRWPSDYVFGADASLANQQNANDVEKRMQNFVRIGKDVFDSPANPKSSPMEGFENGDKRASGFIRIGKSHDITDDDETDSIDLHGNNKRNSAFVRIGKAPLDSLRANIENVFTRGPSSEEEENPSFEKEAEAMQFNKMRGDVMKSDMGDEAGESITDVSSSTGQSFTPDKRSSNFVRIGRAETSPDSKRKRNQQSYNFSNGQAFTPDKRSSSFVRIGRAGTSSDNKRKRSQQSYNFDALQDQLSSALNKLDPIKQSKRSSYPLVDASPGSSESMDDMDAVLSLPHSKANRRSAFVRIGKIPSSAFVRIGKNIGRMLQQLPPYDDRMYHKKYRRGHPMFVRIG